MKRTSISIIVGLLILSLSSKAQEQPQQAEKVAVIPKYEFSDLPMVDMKDFKKNDEGAYILFDGSSLNGWRGYNKAHVPERWSIEDGLLKFAGKSAKTADAEGGDLIFAHNFKNFELEFDWKISHAGNSGVFVLAKEVKDQPIYISSPEYQLLDNDNHPDASQGVDGNRKSASLYDMIPAKPQNGKPAGEWNKAKIVVNDGTVSHYQNDVKVVEYTLWTGDWIKLLRKSKFSSSKWPLAFHLLSNVGGKSKSGVIGFQDHSDDVWLKNITLKEL